MLPVVRNQYEPTTLTIFTHNMLCVHTSDTKMPSMIKAWVKRVRILECNNCALTSTWLKRTCAQPHRLHDAHQQLCPTTLIMRVPADCNKHAHGQEAALANIFTATNTQASLHQMSSP